MWRYNFGDSFQGAKAYIKQLKVSKIFEFVTNNTTDVCFDFWWRNLRFLPTLVGEHEKIHRTIQKFLPWRLESSLFIKFVVNNTSNGFFISNLTKYFLILKSKISLFFVCLTNRMTCHIWRWRTIISWKAGHSALTQTRRTKK